MRTVNCSTCKNEIPPDETVFTRWRNSGGECQSCGVKPRMVFRRGVVTPRYGNPMPCDGCQRPVADATHRRSDYSLRFCNSGCEAYYYKQFRKPKPMHHPTCQSCGETFKAKRTDAKFCSNRCRVAKHREKR